MDLCLLSNLGTVFPGRPSSLVVILGASLEFQGLELAVYRVIDDSEASNA
jgi:hypothetical protein